ncbi:hypothetical protein CRENBAI_013580 [Crenichthys baileyi]|uniref:Uncharacterized protein n=1 Tax=Crenichthys baileyi TaxID=28760 RepID=A0AAV9S532_9TELE
MFPADPHYALGPAKSVRLSPPPADPTHHQVLISGQLSPSLHSSVQNMRPKIGEAIPPDHASPGVTAASHVGVGVPSRIMESPGGALSSTPDRDAKKAGYSTLPPGLKAETTETCPQPKGAGIRPSHPLGKPQHETAELGGNKQTQPSPPPLPVGHSRVDKSPAPLRRWVPEPNYF